MANKIYTNREASRTWSDTGTTSDELLDMGGLAADAVVMGSFWDRGAGAIATLYEAVFLITGFDTAPVVGETVLLYFVESNTTTGFDGKPSTEPTDTAEGTMTLNQIKNIGIPVVILSVVSTTAADKIQARARIVLTGRYIAPVVHNNTADALLSSSDAHLITLTPIPDELQ